jgi:hypothetical protein
MLENLIFYIGVTILGIPILLFAGIAVHAAFDVGGVFTGFVAIVILAFIVNKKLRS